MTTKRKPATTDAAIKNAKPESKAYKLTVGQGIHLFVRPTGTKTFRLKYRFAGKEKLLTIGEYPEISLAKATLQALEAKERLRQGIDPVAHQQEQRRQLEDESNKLTFKSVAERWFKNNAELAKKPWAKSTAIKVRKYLKKDLLPAFGSYPIAEITRKQLNELILEIEKRGAYDVGKSTRDWLNGIFNEALDNGDIEHSPAYRLKPSIYAKGYESTPFPNVGFNGLQQLINDIEASKINILLKIALKLLILNAPRPSELRLATWSEFDLKAALWHIPAERTKTRKPHTLPLSRQSLELLNQIREINPSGYLFVLRGNQPFSDNTLTISLKRLGYKNRQVPHGFRHLFSTEMNQRGYNSDHIESQLAHRGKNQIRATYNQADYLEQRRTMMQDWADSIDALAAGANMVAFKRGQA